MIFIYSQGGFAREFARLVRAQYPDEDLCFVDDNPQGSAMIYADVVLAKGTGSAKMIIGFASPTLRETKSKQAQEDGFELVSVIAETAIIGENVSIGSGAVFSDFSMVTSDAKIGHNFQCNIYSYVAHDCIIGDNVTFAPRVSVNGRVNIGDNVYIGTGATILPGTEEAPMTIGDGAIIGAHALVTKPVASAVTVVGAPAKVIGKK